MRKQIPFAWRAAVLLIAIAGCGAVVWAQTPTSLPASAALVASPSDPEPGAVRLLVGRSTVLDVGTAIARVSLTSPDIADALVTSPSQLLINGKLPGTISMFVWDRGGSLRRYEVIVQRDLARLAEQVRQLFPGEQIDVQSNGKNVVLSGVVSNKDVIEKAVNVAAGYVDKKDEVVPLLSLQAGAPTNQVLLHVRFAEVSRSTMTQLGVNFFTGPGGFKGEGNLGRTTTGQYPAPTYGEFGKGTAAPGDGPITQTFSDFLNLFFFSNKYNVGAVIQAMQQKGLFQSLAEPNLVAESGKEASFLAGGEFPVPIAQGIGTSLAVTVQYKEFGIRLSFTPTVVADRIQLKVRPEVSTLDYANAVTLNGFRIPALSTRRTETELELQNGQTFAIAGLLSNSVNSTLQKIPGIGDIPVLGLLFKSKEAQKNQTELVVMITPEILANNAPGAAPALPRTPEQYIPPMPEKGSFPAPPPAFTPGRSASAADSAATVAAMAPGQAPAVKPATTPAPAQLATMPGANVPASQATSTPAMTERDKKVAAQAQKQEQEKAAELAKAQARSDAAQAKADAKTRETAAKQAAAQAKADEEAKKKAEKQAKDEAKKQANTQSGTQHQ